MLITLIRHGETVANVDRIAQGHSDGQLTERGIFQACQLRKRLAKEKITHLIVSDLGRTKHTAWLALGPSVCVHGGTHMCDNGVDVDSVASDILDAAMFPVGRGRVRPALTTEKLGSSEPPDLSSNTQLTKHVFFDILGCGVRVEYSKEVREKGCGVLEGQRVGSSAVYAKAANVSPSKYRPEGGESWEDVGRRATLVIHNLLNLYASPKHAGSEPPVRLQRHHRFGSLFSQSSPAESPPSFCSTMKIPQCPFDVHGQNQSQGSRGSSVRRKPQEIYPTEPHIVIITHGGFIMKFRDVMYSLRSGGAVPVARGAHNVSLWSYRVNVAHASTLSFRMSLPRVVPRLPSSLSHPPAPEVSVGRSRGKIPRNTLCNCCGANLMKCSNNIRVVSASEDDPLPRLHIRALAENEVGHLACKKRLARHRGSVRTEHLIQRRGTACSKELGKNCGNQRLPDIHGGTKSLTPPTDYGGWGRDDNLDEDDILGCQFASDVRLTTTR
eukprot:Rmarinus@m.20345